MSWLEVLIVVLVLFWLIGGVGLHVGGSLINLILVIAVVCLIVAVIQRVRP